MITMEQEKAFIIAMKAGEIMMQNGGEIYRVEDVITKICHSYDIPTVEVFATPTGIFASIGVGNDAGDLNTSVKAIHDRTTNLKKISDVNHLADDVIKKKIPLDDALKKIDIIEKETGYKEAMMIVGAGAVSGVFCGVYGGNIAECFIAFFVGMFTYFVSIVLGRYNVTYFIVDFCCCACASLLALISEAVGLCSSHDAIIIGTLMLFVPGAAITNALRDFLTGDMLSGLSRLTEAVAIAIALAVGAGVVLKIWSLIGGLF